MEAGTAVQLMERLQRVESRLRALESGAPAQQHPVHQHAKLFAALRNVDELRLVTDWLDSDVDAVCCALSCRTFCEAVHAKYVQRAIGQFMSRRFCFTPSFIQTASRSQLRYVQVPYSKRCLVEMAAACGRIHVLQWALEREDLAENGRFGGATTRALRSAAFQGAAKHGHVHVLNWGCEQGLLDRGEWMWCGKYLLRGGMAVLEWARDCGYVLQPTENDFLNDMMRGDAAGSGDLGLVHLLSAVGIVPRMKSCLGAAKDGHLVMLQTLRAEGCEWGNGAEVVRLAASRGHLNIVEWALANGADWPDSDWNGLIALVPVGIAERRFNMHPCHHGSRRSYLEMHVPLPVLQWFHAQGREIHPGAYLTAAYADDLPVLRWLREIGVPWHPKSSIAAVNGGQLPTLIWLRDQGCTLSPHVLSYAACHGYVEIAQWARAYGGGFGLACILAAGRGHLAMLQWLHEAGAPWGVQEPIEDEDPPCELGWGPCEAAVLNGPHLKVLEWLVAHGCPLGESTCAMGDLEREASPPPESYVKYSVEWYDHKACATLAKRTVDFLRANGCTWK
jgi:hypothetical protein